MMDARMTRLLDDVLATHGGIDRWRSLEAIEIDVSAHGSLFHLKHRPPLTHQRVKLSTREPHVWFPDFPRASLTGEFRGDAEVSVRDRAGTLVAHRSNPRERLLRYRRSPFWDDLDFLYFSGYALWNYLTTPFLFTYPGFRLEPLSAVQTAGGLCRRLRVEFPPTVPTHSREQVFYFDDRAHLVRLDYTADVVGWWARGAHLCGGHRHLAGLLVPTVRRVTPRILRRPLPGPTVVALNIHDVREVR